MWFRLRDENASLTRLRCATCHQRPGGNAYSGEWAHEAFREGTAMCLHIPVVGAYDNHDEYQVFIYAAGFSDCDCGCGHRVVNPADDATLNMFNTRHRSVTEQITARYRREGRGVCDHCLGWGPLGSFVTAHNNGSTMQVCASCLDTNNFHTCDGACGNLYHRYSVSRLTVQVPHGLFPGSFTEERRNFCPDCYQEAAPFQCSHCSRIFLSPVDSCGYCVQDEDGEYVDCTCYSCSSGGRWINNYSYRPPLEVKAVGPEAVHTPTGDRTLYLGIELEVEVPGNLDVNRIAKRVTRDGGGHLYMKSDGSINHGFEIVSHPATLDWWMRNFDWSKVIRSRRVAGDIRAESNCGLHIHASRAALDGKSHQLRLMQFWWRNQNALRALAGRDSSYARYSDTQRSMLSVIASRPPRNQVAERYSAINTNNVATLEFRVFESTLFVNRIKSSLQLVESTIEYTRQLSVGKILKDGGYSWAEYERWLMARAGRYGDLLASIARVSKGVPFGYAARSARVNKIDRFGNYVVDEYGSYETKVVNVVTMEGVK